MFRLSTRTPCLLLTLPLLALTAGCQGGKKPDAVTEDVALMVGAGLSNTDQSTDTAIEFNGDTDETSTNLELGVTVPVGDRLSAELAYVDLADNSWDGTWLGSPNKGSFSTKGLRLGLTATRPMGNSPRWSWVGTTGLFLTDQDYKENDAGTIIKESNSGTDVFVGVGAERRISEQVAARVLLSRYFHVEGDNIDTLTFGILFGLR